MSDKPKLNLQEQILHMQKQGIRFEECSIKQAEEFLTKSNYYFRIKAFAKNYEKIERNILI